MIEQTPELVERLIATLDHWDVVSSPGSKPLRDQWRVIIKECNWKLATEDSQMANQLRQASPMATILPSAIRIDIIRALRKIKDFSRAEI